MKHSSGATAEMQVEGRLRAAGPEEVPPSPPQNSPRPLLPPRKHQSGDEAASCLLQRPFLGACCIHGSRTSVYRALQPGVGLASGNWPWVSRRQKRFQAGLQCSREPPSKCTVPSDFGSGGGCSAVQSQEVTWVLFQLTHSHTYSN